MPKNVTIVHFHDEQPVLFSTLWGHKSQFPPLFKSRWERMRAAAEAAGLSRDARKRLEWMIWYETTGNCNARRTCRHFSIAPKVFYYWRNRYKENALQLLEHRSHRPHRVRQPAASSEQVQRIFDLRRQYICYSKAKLAVLYREMYGEPISEWQIQKVIQKYKLYPNPKKNELLRRKVKNAWKKRRITELAKQPEPGFLFCLDTIVRHIESQKRYILTAIDRHSRLAFARMYSTHSSAAAADFLRRLYSLMNGQIVNIQTDNGSEFHKHFEKAAQELGLQHWWSRTQTPKDNAICERFNRTLQEEFIGQGNAYYDVRIFNEKLTEWLIEYDFHRPHAALEYKRPIEIACLGTKVSPINSSRTQC